ncbi:precorrin-3B C(17)-methyltransferase [Streptomyces collinus]|uniref:Cobalt-precorrin 5A hydrolase/precorrin-3B C17-methyltransferase n=2 Tax=Streptomyces TaxID=1883 RepID=A0AA89QBH0_STRCU|nr:MULTISPECIES: precorrin-3B C(17)-methyltransferase [Streptomyces]MBB5810179.1 cobalt-precorrin 5A hydrolase/precorrin-3B C17-methyltransferase [Streptomyces collinus]MEC7053075.1 precorrin-3B C(17)-methyltransferase [Streptomyces violaceochromogenes]WMX63470.1 precorrin-3B C(17)-methyltransferase [Streptomyces collinus]GHC56445.1 precorrin-3B C(17)-methyltransferase [Streptomyces violaceochromogenes]
MIGLISATAAGAAARDRLAAAWPDRTRVYEGPVGDAVRTAFAQCEQLVCFLATGAVVRLVAPLLSGKTEDPGVVCVDEGGRFAVSLLGGHAGGANELAREVGDVLGAEPVVTTATDAVDLAGLDTLGLPVEGDVAGVSRALLDGEAVALRAEVAWPLPPLPVAEEGSYTIRLTDRLVETAEREAVLRPPTLVVGVGASKGAPVEEVLGLVRDALREAGLSVASVAELATVDAKSEEAGIVEAARRLGVPLVTYSAEELAGVDVPNPSDAPLAAVGTPSVAEAAALVGGGELLVPKRKSAASPAMATCAVVRRPGRGRLAVVGLGPGARDLLTPRAKAELRRASVLVGLDQYVDQIRDLLRPGTRILESGLGAEEERARTAVEEAREGQAVALIGSGDAGVYAMASPALAEASDDIDVVGVPGVTAALAAGAILGAPLGHDHVSISLSDLHTPWEVIERRVRAAAEADIVVTFYNPRSRGRDWQLPKALGILAEHRAPQTPVGVVRNASRPDESSRLTTLGALDPATVDMMTVVTVGNTATRDIAGRMVTPRGYRWQSAQEGSE